MFRLLVVGVLFLCIPVSSVLAQDEEPTTGIVTFTVDSLTSDFYENRFPEFKARNIPGTLYIQTDPVNTGPWGMDWDDMRAVHAAGWEIGAHSYSHEYGLTNVDDRILDLELGEPAARIYREINVYPKTFASPFGDYDERVLERVRVYYDAHFRAWGNVGVNEFDSTDHFHINRTEVMYDQTVDEICTQIKRAGTDPHWLVLMLHTIVDGTPEKYQISHATLEGMLSCAQDFRENGLVQIMTAADAIDVVPHTPRSE